MDERQRVSFRLGDLPGTDRDTCKLNVQCLRNNSRCDGVQEYGGNALNEVRSQSWVIVLILRFFARLRPRAYDEASVPTRIR